MRRRDPIFWHAYFWAPQQWENNWGAKKFKSLLFLLFFSVIYRGVRGVLFLNRSNATSKPWNRTSTKILMKMVTNNEPYQIPNIYLPNPKGKQQSK